LTTGNPEANKDMMLFDRLGINTETIASSEVDEAKIKTAVVDQQNSDLFYNAVN
jgi:biotin synthase